MNAATAAPTLHDDWLARREMLSRGEVPEGSLAEAQLRVLDYLIQRYGGRKESQRPARFALSAKLVCNERRIVVHHHLGQGKVGGARSQSEAEGRVQFILQRMQSSKTADQDDGEDPFAIEYEPESTAAGWRYIRYLHLSPRDQRIAVALTRSPYLCSEDLNSLAERLSDPDCKNEVAVELLDLCENRNAPVYAVDAWIQRVRAGCRTDAVSLSLEDYLQQPEHRPLVVEQLRDQLASEYAPVRLASIELMGQLGDLDDVSLLSDLLRLPNAEDETRGERGAMVAAIKAISRREHGEPS